MYILISRISLSSPKIIQINKIVKMLFYPAEIVFYAPDIGVSRIYAIVAMFVFVILLEYDL